MEHYIAKMLRMTVREVRLTMSHDEYVGWVAFIEAEQEELRRQMEKNK